VAGGMFWYVKQNKQEPVNPPVTENENQNSEVINLKSEIDTSDWLTYRNEEYGFEVKYPGELVANINPKKSDYEKNITGELQSITFRKINSIYNEFYLSIGIVNNIFNYSSVDEYIKGKFSSPSEVGVLQINDYKYKNMTGKDVVMSGPEGKYQLIILKNKDKFYILSPNIKKLRSGIPTQELNTINSIINSFQFIN